MARQVLENGVILPAEYSDDWYDDMTSNLTKLDDVIGSDSEKLSSSDVGAAALSNNYNDLDNLPTIPTVNDATLTIQKNGVDVQTFTANASSNVTANITVPTKTSDLTNDSNFVDTSNPAVSSGITSAKVTDYDTHIADTDIHVTTADKNKWNNQTYVFRYSSTALTASSTNANSLLDNTDNLKVGDKVIDSSGVLFSITAIDTENSTFTIGTALIDLAQDSDVVHKSGDETISGTKTFLDIPIPFKSSTAELGVTGGSTKIIFTDKNLLNLAGITFGNYESSKLSYCRFHIYDKDSNNQEVENFIEFSYVNNNQFAYFRPNKSNVTLGTVSNRWSRVYADEFYYGSNNVKFSDKFITTDTNQTISGAKTFSEDVVIGNSDTTQSSKRLVLRSYKASLSGSNSDNWGINFNAGASYAVAINAHKSTDGAQGLTYTVRTQDSNNNIFTSSYRFRVFIDGNSVLEPDVDNNVSLGRSTNRWKDCQTNLINGLTPSSLSLPSNTGYIDISSYFTNTGDGQTNSYTASANGWIYLNVTAKTLIMQIRDSNDNVVYADMCNRSSDGTIYMTIPIGSGNKLLTQWFTSSSVTITTARFIPCQGNV